MFEILFKLQVISNPVFLFPLFDIKDNDPEPELSMNSIIRTRQRLGITQYQLAKRTGRSVQHLSQIEHGNCYHASKGVRCRCR